MTRIRRVTVSGLRYRAGSLHRAKWGETEEACVVELLDDDGARGVAIARCHAGRSAAAFREEIAALVPLVQGEAAEDVSGIATVFRRTLHLHLAQYVSIFAVSAIDVALWDLVATRRGVPVRALIVPGAEAVTHVSAYASLPLAPSAEQAVAAARAAYDEGFATVKLHATGDVERDIQLVRALRTEFGVSAPMAFDAGRRLDRDGALAVARILHELGFAWFEEPFEPYADEDYAWLASRVPMPLAGFETAPGGPDGARWAIERGLFGRLLVDSAWKGGISGVLRVADAAVARRQQLLMHHGASAVMNLANMQLAAARPELGAVELLAPYGEYDVATALPALSKAGIALPEVPGLGVEWDEDFLRAHRVGEPWTVEV